VQRKWSLVRSSLSERAIATFCGIVQVDFRQRSLVFNVMYRAATHEACGILNPRRQSLFHSMHLCSATSALPTLATASLLKNKFSNTSRICKCMVLHLSQILCPQDPILTLILFISAPLSPLALLLQISRRINAIILALLHCDVFANVKGRCEHAAGYSLLWLCLQSYVHTVQFWK
jgi:hypothetical protein